MNQPTKVEEQSDTNWLFSYYINTFEVFVKEEEADRAKNQLEPFVVDHSP